MTYRVIASIALLTFIGPSCSTTRTGRPERLHPLSEISEREAAVKRLEKIVKRYDRDDTPADARKRLRDQYARISLGLVNHNYDVFLDRLSRNRKGFDASSTVTAVALDTASVLFTPASTKSILAGLSGLTTASQTAINKAYFYEQTLPALISQMKAARASVRADIHAGLDKPDASYGLHRLMSDLNRYYQAGTIDGALEDIQLQAGERAAEAQKRLTGRAQSELDAELAQREKNLRTLQREADFEEKRTATLENWKRLDPDQRSEICGIIPALAAEYRVVLVGVIDAELATARLEATAFESTIEGLEFATSGHREFLARVASNIEVQLSPIEPETGTDDNAASGTETPIENGE